ncbi:MULTISPECIES: hypothetical protein [unclassified Crossiella]|uniref:hypothetical protein n=1 Tax=unclassified Crossiella TaxID=2620835 RepID=UPI001FFFF61B|nr:MULTISPECIES: hypothetical protein [unclassified Crossiella]MCK2239401.1 hypothetical protein [Crossiella sp. S99.2]MCK2252096.1 hypothetical protein [Crossiella sp. S99.1]
MDLLDLYRGQLSLRRVCLLVEHLPQDAALWRTLAPDADWTRTDLLLLAVERRLTAVWALLAGMLGQKLTEDQLAPPLIPGNTTENPSPPGGGEPETRPLREIALMMRGA